MQDGGRGQDLFSGVDAGGSVHQQVRDSQESEQDIIIQDEELDPSLRLFSMLDSKPELSKLLERLLKSQSSSPSKEKDTLLLEVLKLALVARNLLVQCRSY